MLHNSKLTENKWQRTKNEKNTNCYKNEKMTNCWIKIKQKITHQSKHEKKDKMKKMRHTDSYPQCSLQSCPEY